MTQIFELCGIRWCFILFCSSLQYRSSKINPAFFVDKASCTRQFESELSLHSLASLFPIKKGFFLPLRLSCKESSTFSPSPSSSGSGDVTALRCSEPLRSKVGGASKPFAILCGMGPPYYNLLLVFAILCGMGPPYYNLLLVFAILCGLGPPGVGSL